MPQYFTDANGWTHVRSKRPQLLAKREERIGKAAQDKALNLEKVLNKYRGYVHHWEKSTCYSDTVAIFDNELLKLEDLQITSCLCTGLGSLTRWHDGSPAASFWQVAALETILGLLGKRFTIQSVYFQDPAFNELDEEFIQSRGFKIVKDPAIFKLVTPTTFLFAPANPWFTIGASLTVAHPALFIGNDLNDFLEHYVPNMLGFAIKYKDVYQSFLQGRLHKTLPNFERNWGALQQTIFWMPDKQEGSQTGGGVEKSAEVKAAAETAE